METRWGSRDPFNPSMEHLISNAEESTQVSIIKKRSSWRDTERAFKIYIKFISE
jgi:hypothetical protein